MHEFLGIAYQSLLKTLYQDCERDYVAFYDGYATDCPRASDCEFMFKGNNSIRAHKWRDEK